MRATSEGFFQGKPSSEILSSFFPTCLVSLPLLLYLTAISSMHLCDEEYTAVNLSLDLIVTPPLLLNYPLVTLANIFISLGSVPQGFFG